MKIQRIDSWLINEFHAYFLPLARFAIFVVYFWFGMLKLLGLSPAEQLVQDLFNQTISFMSFGTFYFLFSCLEVLIGLLFLFPKATRVVLPLLLFHMFTTFLPLVFLPNTAWQSWFVPTLAGQYIIKNLVIIACAIGIAGHLHKKAD